MLKLLPRAVPPVAPVALPSTEGESLNPYPTRQPCPGWLAVRLGELPHPAAVMVFDASTSSGHALVTPEPGDVLDLLHQPTRLAVLLNLAMAGAETGRDWRRWWMLGAPWGRLDNVQAARAVAAALQAVERGKTLPIGVLDVWQEGRRHTVAGGPAHGLVEASVWGAEGEEPTATEERRAAHDNQLQALGMLLVGVDL